MIKVTTVIDCPPHFKSDSDYSSHRPAMWLVFENNKNKIPVVEFGSGHGSTMLFRDWCKYDNVDFTSFENDKDWCKTTKAKFVNDYKEVELPNNLILFIDSKPGEERKDLVKIHEDKDILILHDTEQGARNIYGIIETLKSFKYRLDYCPEGFPATSILSNKINVCEWVK